MKLCIYFLDSFHVIRFSCLPLTFVVATKASEAINVFVKNLIRIVKIYF